MEDELKLSLPDPQAMFGLKLRQLRQAKNWTQSDLAEAIGRKKSTISRIESGDAHPNPSTLRSLAKALDVEYEDLSRPVEEQTPFQKPLLELVQRSSLMRLERYDGQHLVTSHMVLYRAISDFSPLSWLKGDLVYVGVGLKPKHLDLVLTGTDEIPVLSRAHFIPTEPGQPHMLALEPVEKNRTPQFQRMIGVVIELRRSKSFITEQPALKRN